MMRGHAIKWTIFLLESCHSHCRHWHYIIMYYTIWFIARGVIETVLDCCESFWQVFNPRVRHKESQAPYSNKVCSPHTHVGISNQLVQHHPHPHRKHHMGVFPFPLLHEEWCEAFLRAFGLPTHDAVDGVDHWREVFALCMEGDQVLVLFIFPLCV